MEVMWGNLFILLCALSLLQSSICLDFRQLDDIFKDSDCVEGKIIDDEGTAALVTSGNSAGFYGKDKIVTPIQQEKHVLIELQTEIEDNKNAVGLLNELAQFNKVSADFLLVNEEGLSHDKTFYVRLNLGGEVYAAQGKSIKKSKNAAANAALKATKYAHPPSKVPTPKNIEQITPTVMLNNIAAKLGMKVEYVNEVGEVIEEKDLSDTSYNYIALDQTTKGYLSKLNDSMKAAFQKIKVPSGEQAEKSPFSVRVNIGKETFKGTGWTIQAARHDAASNALEHFKKLSVKDAQQCLELGEDCNKLAAKSPISLVHETAAKRSLAVTFKVIDESGPAHKRVFVTSCTIGDGDIVTKGEGSSKKASKKKAAELMLAELEKIEPLAVGSTINVNVDNKKRKKNKIAKGFLNNAKANVLDAVSSVLSTMSGAPEETTHSSDSEQKDSPISKKSELLNLSNSIGVNVNFAKFQKGDLFATIVTLDTNPAYICYDKDITSAIAEENAALSALKFIKEVGLDNIIIPLKDTKEAKVRLDIKSKQLRDKIGSSKDL